MRGVAYSPSPLEYPSLDPKIAVQIPLDDIFEGSCLSYSSHSPAISCSQFVDSVHFPLKNYYSTFCDAPSAGLLFQAQQETGLELLQYQSFHRIYRKFVERSFPVSLFNVTRVTDCYVLLEDQGKVYLAVQGRAYSNENALLRSQIQVLICVLDVTSHDRRSPHLRYNSQ